MPGLCGQSRVLPATTEKSRHSAAKRSGLAPFVDASCSDIRPNYPRFREIIHNLGIDLDQLASGDVLLTSSEYMNAYRKDVSSGCERALEQFGVDGTTIPGFLDAK